MEMPPILYFFPKRTKPTEELEILFQNGQNIAQNQSGPPDFDKKCQGLLISRYPDSIISADQETQRWEDFGDYWIGVNENYFPEDFIKEDPKGIKIRMADGKNWLIPKINPEFLDDIDLMIQDKLIPDPESKDKIKKRMLNALVVAPQDRWLADIGALLAHICKESIIETDGAFEIPDDDINDYIYKALSFNYDLTLNEAYAIGVFGESIYIDCINQMVNINRLQTQLFIDLSDFKVV